MRQLRLLKLDPADLELMFLSGKLLLLNRPLLGEALFGFNGALFTLQAQGIAEWRLKIFEELPRENADVLDFDGLHGNPQSPATWLLVPKMGKLASDAPSAHFSFHDMRAADVVRGFRECCEKAKLTPNLRFSCASFTQVAELVRSGHAVALLPEMAEACLRASGVRRFNFAPMRTYRREIGVVWHPRLVSIRPQSESVLAGLKEIAA
jgi:DNA-binding transcriptional LysR family regulator